MTRRKRYERQNPPPPMQITPRDLDIVEAIYHYRILSQTHIRRLLFADLNPTVAQRRLSLLYDHAYVDRRALPSIGGVLTSPMLYVLDKRGSELLCRERGYADLRWRPQDKTLGYEHVEHLLDINTFRIEITLACQTLSAINLTTWVDDTTLKQDYDRVQLSYLRQPVSLIPDGYFVIQDRQGKMTFFLELDRGTMSVQRFKTKISAYQMYAMDGQAKHRFGTSRFRVLTVTLTPQRLARLKASTETLDRSHRFWFGILPDLTAPDLLIQPVWQVAGLDQPATLLKITDEPYE